jgi:uncharacterized protein
MEPFSVFRPGCAYDEVTVTPATRSTLATVVAVQHPKRGRVDAFLTWQEKVNSAAARVPGYLGTELLRPDSDDEGGWTTIYRFASVDFLRSWLQSEELRELLGQAAGIFAEPPSRHIMISEDEEETVTAVFSHRVSPGEEAGFQAFQRRMTDAAQRFPGFRGNELLKPVAGIEDKWTALSRFDTAEHLDAWLGSAERQRLLAEEGKRFAEFELHRISPRYGSWFSSLQAGEEAAGPPAWKSALSVLVGLYPTVFLLTLGLDEAWPDADLWLGLLVGSILSVATLTWVVMPVVTRLLGFWLAPAGPEAGPRREVLGTAVSIAFLTLAAAVFWLVSAQVWALP